MKKLLLILFGLLLAVAVSAQSTRVYNQNIQINKTTPVLDLQGLGAKIYLDGATSGTATLQPPAVAGATVHTLPSATGTLTNFEDTTLTLATQWKARDAVHDTVQMERDNAELGLALVDTVGGSSDNDYVPGTEYMESYVETYAGGELTGKILRFIVDVTTGAPTNADSTIIHSEFDGKHIDLYRNGDLQYFHTESANTIDSTYRINVDTVFVKPLWSNNERVEIRILTPITWSYLALEGEESDLLDSLSVFYKADETSGSSVIDAQGVQNGTMWYVYTNTASGKYNYAKELGAKGVMSITSNDAVMPRYDDYSVAMWVYLTTPADVSGHANYLFSQKDDDVSPASTIHRLYIDGTTADSNKVIFLAYNETPTAQTVKSTIKLNSGRWYHICAVRPTAGNPLKIYIDGVDRTASAVNASGNVLFDTSGSNTTYFGNVGYNFTSNLVGRMDDYGIWRVALTGVQCAALYNSTVSHPW